MKIWLANIGRNSSRYILIRYRPEFKNLLLYIKILRKSGFKVIKSVSTEFNNISEDKNFGGFLFLEKMI